MNFHPDLRFGIALFLFLILSGLGAYFYSTQEMYAVQVPHLSYITPNGQPYTTYTTEYYPYTVYPYRSLGAILLFASLFVGVGTVLYHLDSKRRLKEML
jgi:hypothetical protein